MAGSDTMRVKILRFIVGYQERTGFTPSIREIGTGVGLASTSSVANQLDGMVSEGLISRGKGPRMIRVLVEPPER